MKTPLDPTRPGAIHKFSIGGLEGYVIVNVFPDGDMEGEPAEVFLRVSKEGSALSGLCRTIGRLVSVALKHGTPLDEVVKTLEGETFEPNGYGELGDGPVVHFGSLATVIAAALHKTRTEDTLTWYRKVPKHAPKSAFTCLACGKAARCITPDALCGSCKVAAREAQLHVARTARNLRKAFAAKGLSGADFAARYAIEPARVEAHLGALATVLPAELDDYADFLGVVTAVLTTSATDFDQYMDAK